MSGAWWLARKDLDRDQNLVISLPVDESAQITGPPGCGKTNLLLLRANYYYLQGLRNICILTLTRSLTDFIKTGADQYDFPTEKITTIKEWQIAFLRQFGEPIPASIGDFGKDRAALGEAVNALIDRRGLTKLYQAILLDEAQDCLPSEVDAFAKVAERIFCSADERQKIYRGPNSLLALQGHIKHNIALTYHYRNGLNICKIADAIAKENKAYRALSATSNYNEKANPSTVESFRLGTLTDQVNAVIDRLGIQMAAFPKEFIGVLVPKVETMGKVWQEISASRFGRSATLIHGSSDDPPSVARPILVSSFHAAKGFEFRAAHLLACEELSKFSLNRNMAYTAVTRAKTSLTLYYSKPLLGYLERAIDLVGELRPPPSIDDIFGKKK